MGRPKNPQTFFPLYADKWLWGSTREELDAEERSVFLDFLCLATKTGGYIAANAEDGIPYSARRLAGILMVKTELIERTVEKCIKTNKLERLESGILKVTSWDSYQLSDRYIRKLKAEHSAGKPEHSAGKPEPIGEDRIGEDRRGEDIIDEDKSSSNTQAQETSSPSEAPKRKAKTWRDYTEEELAKKTRTFRCVILWERCYFEKLGIEFLARQQALAMFKRYLDAGWKLEDWIPIYFATKDKFVQKFGLESFDSYVKRQKTKGAKDE